MTREQAIEILRYTSNVIHQTINGKTDGLDMAIKALEQQPVTPTRKKGEWCKQNDDYFDWYECSECGYGSEGEMQYSSECDVRTKYCPNCGADMREEQMDKQQVETVLRGCVSKQDAILHLKNHLVNSNYRNYIIGELKKLKKIEQIVKDYDTNCGLEEYMYLEQIKEILEQE